MRKFFAAIMLTGVIAAAAAAQTTAFTYQGRLTDAGLPANGAYDFHFWLFDTLADGTGTQIGTANVTNVTVTNGSFTATIDFGANAFSGADRFMQIVVRPSFADPSVRPTILSPRQQLTTAPYAIHSVTAANADIAANATQLGGTSANQFVLTGDSRLSDARQPSPGSADYIQNGTTPQASTNFNVSGAGKADTFDAATQFNIAGVRVLGNGGLNNFFAGQNAGQSISTGDSNAFFGAAAGQSTADGRENSFFGRDAGRANTAGSFNAFFGTASGRMRLTTTPSSVSLPARAIRAVLIIRSSGTRRVFQTLTRATTHCSDSTPDTALPARTAA